MTVGLHQTAYTVTEGNAIVLVCTAVLSGDIAGRTLTIDYNTADGDARGIVRKNHIIYVSSE